MRDTDVRVATKRHDGHAASGIRGWLKFAALTSLLLLATVGFAGLGTWQVHRLAWKRDLIARVNHRVHAPPVSAPGPSDWPSVSAARFEYRHVRIIGRFLNDKETLVLASTALGQGDWVLTPFRTGRGFTVLVNRGFIPPELRNPASRAKEQVRGTVAITGLLRLTEPGGAFLRHNVPTADRWYSRDVAAIAKARELTDVAPYFIDADLQPDQAGPVGGLTVITFPNNHLLYAITWYLLALMTLAAAAYLGYDKWRRSLLPLLD